MAQAASGPFVPIAVREPCSTNAAPTELALKVDARFELRIPLGFDAPTLERRIRSIALGRRNFLLAGSNEGAQRAASIYSLLACRTLVNVEPQDWPTDEPSVLGMTEQPTGGAASGALDSTTTDHSQRRRDASCSAHLNQLSGHTQTRVNPCAR